jgi:hypothetical protein
MLPPTELTRRLQPQPWRGGKKRYFAYDAEDRFLGQFKSRGMTYAAVGAAAGQS